MAQYIYITIATHIMVRKQNEIHFQEHLFLKEEIKKQLGKYFNLSLYDEYENERIVGFYLKDEIIDRCLYDFLREQSYDLMCTQQMQAEISQLKNRDGQEILQMIRDCQLEFVHYQDFDIPKRHYFAPNLDIYLEGITYLSEGKIMLEYSHELFSYIHSLLRKSYYSELKDATYICIA